MPGLRSPLLSEYRFAYSRVLAVVVLFSLRPCLMQGSDVERHRVAKVTGQTASLRIPKIDRAPNLEEFLNMQVPPEWKGKLAEATGFVQRSPDNGRPAT